MKKIKSIFVDGASGSGWKNADDNNPIVEISKNGEMASVPWYKQGDTEWNGKYVVEINYYPGEEADIDF